jgi:hypothetical protein
LSNGSGSNVGGREPEPERDALLVEYQAAQDSAQHHDSITWTVISIVWGASLVLMGFILGNLQDRHLRPLLTVLSMLGIFLTAWVWYARGQLNEIKKQKYERCKSIERILGMNQHSVLKYEKGRIGSAIAIMSVAFIVAWVALLFTVWCCQCSS